MDLYIERYWGDFAHAIAVDAKTAINRQLQGKLAARNDRRFTPDFLNPKSDPWRQTFVKIIDAAADDQVCTIIEFVGPTNYYPANVLEAVQARRRECIETGISFVEIDLTGNYRLVSNRNYDYVVNVFNALTERSERYTSRLRQRLPGILIPVPGGGSDVVLDLQPLVDEAYESGRYGLTIDYSRPLSPPLDGDDAAWAEQLLRTSRV